MNGIRIGQIWQEADKRFVRYVRVEAVGEPYIMIRRVVEREGGGWVEASKSYRTIALRTRFGKSGGYRLHQEPSP